MTSTKAKSNLSSEDKLFHRNLFMFSIGTIGRDFLFNFFNGFLLTFILLTKNLTAAQFGSITAIIVAARIFDALNDPVMGGIVESTHTKWGKYKPWQLIGAVSTGVVIILLFNLPLYGWAFIGFLAFSYFMFSITFSMNDIAYWGMMPSLTSDPNKRNTITSAAQICVSIGGGGSGILIPLLTTGNIGTAVFGSAGRAFGVIAVAASVLMVFFQLFTIFGVKEPNLAAALTKKERMKFKDIFRAIAKNDQLLWAAICLLFTNIGTNTFTGGLSTMYIYFEFGYDGLLTVLFSALSAVMSVVVTLVFPGVCKKWGRAKVLYFSSTLAICGYLLLMFIGLFSPQLNEINISLLGFEFHFTGKFILLIVANLLTGAGAYYMIQTVNMANSVEYNELRTGRREESLVFSLRPFANKMGSALSQGLVSLVYVIAGVLAYTNRISAIENAYNSHASLTTEEATQKLTEIGDVLHSVPTWSKNVLLICMCLIPSAFIAASLILHKRFFRLDESKMAEINAALADRKAVAENEKDPETASSSGTL